MGTKQAKLVSLLSRKSGVTLEKAAEALGWQKHTPSVTIHLSKEGLLFYLPINEDPESWEQINLLIEEPMVLRRRGQETKLILG